MKTIEQRFWEKVGPHDDPHVCWLWLAATVPSRGLRYGYFWDGSRMVYAHRLSYELQYGSIPDGMPVDHVKARGCTSTLCVNPAHLEVVTHKENNIRSNSPSALCAKKMCCSQGHPYDKENTRVYHDKRYCRACNRERLHLRYQEQKVVA